jgi:hypothetical protein
MPILKWDWHFCFNISFLFCELGIENIFFILERFISLIPNFYKKTTRINNTKTNKNHSNL